MTKLSKPPIKVADMIESFGSSATAFLVAKNETKNYLSHFKTDFDFQGVLTTIYMNIALNKYCV